MNIQQHVFTEQTKTVGDALSVATVASTLMGWLPAFAALATIIWTCIRIYETKTVQDWLKKRKAKKDTK